MAAKAVEIGYNILQGKPAPTQLVLIPVTFIDRISSDQYKGCTVKWRCTPDAPEGVNGGLHCANGDRYCP